MTREALVDRLVNYADAVAAFSVVNAAAFLVTLADSEVRSSIASAKWLAILGQLLFSLGYAVAVVVLRKAELKLRASGPPVTPEVEQFLRAFFIVRLAIVGVFTLITVAALALIAVT